MDDYSNLPQIFEQLKSDGFLYAVGSGHAGPLGRPLSLLSFALQEDSWPAAKPFIAFNVGVHVFNSACVFYLALLLLREGSGRLNEKECLVLAFLLALVWACAPIQVSSVLYIVQRMTLLSASFVLLALLAFVHGRRLLLLGSKWAGLLIICVVCPLMGVLGLLAKETAFLLVVYLLVVEFWLSGLSKVDDWLFRRLVIPVLLSVFAGFLLYLTSLAFTFDTLFSRNFNVFERLMTEARVVWEYLSQIIFPRISSLGLYFDDYKVSRNIFSPISTLMSVIAWGGVLVLLGVAVIRGFYIASFGIMWFLGGHLLESTTLNLELYFEHRNYLPTFGIWFALFVGGYLFLRQKLSGWRRLGVLLSGGVYILLLLAQGAYVVKQWGMPDKLAYYYSKERPESIRAREMALFVFQMRGSMSLMKDELDSMNRDFPDNLTVKLISLEYGCLYPGVVSYSFEPRMIDLAKGSRISPGALGAISDLFDRLNHNHFCDGYNMNQLLMLVDALADGEAYKRSFDDVISLKVELLLHSGLMEEAMEAMDELKTPNYDMRVRRIQLLAGLGRYTEALSEINELRNLNRYSLLLASHESYLSSLVEQIEQDIARTSAK